VVVVATVSLLFDVEDERVQTDIVTFLASMNPPGITPVARDD